MSLEIFSDYLEEIELDISQYNKDNNIKYNNKQPIVFNLKNLQSFSGIDFTELHEYCDNYFINNDDRFDKISNKIYETTTFWWLIPLINNISYYDMPLSEVKLKELALYLYENEYKYSSEDIYYEKLKEVNDLKREIKVIKSEYLYIILRKIYDFMKG